MKKLSSLHPAIQESAVYGTGTLLSQVIAAVRGLIIASLLGPASYGLWKSVQVVLDWLSYTHAGVLHGMARSIPISRQSGNADEENASRGTGLIVAVISSVLAGGVLVAVTSHSTTVSWGVWIGIAALLLLTQLFRFIHMICLAEGRFAVLSSANLLMALLSLLFMLWWVPKYGVYGVLLGLGGGYLGAIFLGFARSIYLVSWGGFSFSQTAKRLAFAGFPFMAVDGLFVVWQRLDRVILIPFYGAESAALGYYGLATMVASFAIQIPQVFTRVLFRRTVPVFEAMGEDSEEARQLTKKHLEIPCLLAASTSPLLLSLGIAGSWMMVFYFLPDYSSIRNSEIVGCEESIALLLVAAYGCSLGLSFRNIYTGINRQWRLAAIYVITSVVTLLPPLLLLYGEEGLDPSGIKTAGWGMVLGSTLFAVIALVDCCSIRGSDLKETIGLACRATWPLMVFAAWTWAAVGTLPSTSQEGPPLIYWALLLLSSLIVHTPIAVYGFVTIWKEIPSQNQSAAR